jgi:hypothetical protein
MEIEQLGNGSEFSIDEPNSSFLVTLNSGKKLLVDAGFSIFKVVVERNLAPDVIYITHEHQDHNGSVAQIIMHNYFIHKKKTKLIVAANREQYYVELLRHINYGHVKGSSKPQEIFNMYDMVAIFENDDHHMLDKDTKLSIFKVDHSTPTHGVVVTDQHDGLIISGDTKTTDEFIVEFDRLVEKYGLGNFTSYHDLYLHTGDISNEIEDFLNNKLKDTGVETHATLKTLDEQYPLRVLLNTTFYHTNTDVGENNLLHEFFNRSK